MGRGLIVVGLDPGTTVGYAFLDIRGKLLRVGSAKGLNLDMVVEKATSYGRVVVVGTDKAKCPRFVERFATKVGARLIAPKEDILVKEKRVMVKGYKTKNDHEGDALACALFAYKKIKSLLRKIDRYLKNNGKENFGEEAKEILITRNGISISEAVSMLEKPAEKKVVKIVTKKVEDSKVVKLKKVVKELKREIKLLRKQNIKLEEEIKKLIYKEKTLTKKLDKITPSKKAKKLLREKEKRIHHKQAEINKLVKKNEALKNLLAGIEDNVLLKKLDNLRYDEFLIKNKVLRIQEGDILLVENAEKYNLKTIEVLKEKVSVIVSKKKVPKKLLQHFVFIDGSKLKIEEIDEFGFIQKTELEKAKKDAKVFSSMIEKYQASRKTQYL